MAREKRKIGLMGGTFDPIHIGHLVIAEAARTEFDLEKVIFIPAGNPPHKQESHVVAGIHRYIMTVLATCSNPDFCVSSIEMNRDGLSYTVDTIRTFAELYGEDTSLYFIVGADAAADLPNWHNFQNLLEMCNFVAASRPGFDSRIAETIRYFGSSGKERIHVLATPELEISSTDIRERVRNGGSIRYIVPEAVEAYIGKEGLYQE